MVQVAPNALGAEGKVKGKRKKEKVKPVARDLRERTFAFATRVVKLCRHLETRNGVSRVLARQLLRAGTSVGANLEEAQAAHTRPDFINKNSIALKEARETHYWLRLLTASEEVPEERVAGLQKEAGELMRILGAVVVTARKGIR